MVEQPKISIENQNQPAAFVSEFFCFNTPNEFFITLLDVIPQMEFKSQQIIDSKGNPKKVARIGNSGIIQKVIGRYGMSPASFKKLVHLLNQNLRQYEEKFGEIAILPPEFLH